MSSSVLGFRVCGIQDTCWKLENCEGVGISVGDDRGISATKRLFPDNSGVSRCSANSSHFWSIACRGARRNRINICDFYWKIKKICVLLNGLSSSVCFNSEPCLMLMSVSTTDNYQIENLLSRSLATLDNCHLSRSDDIFG